MWESYGRSQVNSLSLKMVVYKPSMLTIPLQSSPPYVCCRGLHPTTVRTYVCTKNMILMISYLTVHHFVIHLPNLSVTNTTQSTHHCLSLPVHSQRLVWSNTTVNTTTCTLRSSALLRQRSRHRQERSRCRCKCRCSNRSSPDCHRIC